jgi:hypothetical protein
MERLEVELNLAQKEKDRFGVGQLGGLLNFEIFNCGELFFRFRQAASFPTNPLHPVLATKNILSAPTRDIAREPLRLLKREDPDTLSKALGCSGGVLARLVADGLCDRRFSTPDQKFAIPNSRFNLSSLHTTRLCLEQGRSFPSIKEALSRTFPAPNRAFHLQAFVRNSHRVAFSCETRCNFHPRALRKHNLRRLWTQPSRPKPT